MRGAAENNLAHPAYRIQFRFSTLLDPSFCPCKQLKTLIISKSCRRRTPLGLRLAGIPSGRAWQDIPARGPEVRVVRLQEVISAASLAFRRPRASKRTKSKSGSKSNAEWNQINSQEISRRESVLQRPPTRLLRRRGEVGLLAECRRRHCDIRVSSSPPYSCRPVYDMGPVLCTQMLGRRRQL